MVKRAALPLRPSVMSLQVVLRSSERTLKSPLAMRSVRSGNFSPPRDSVWIYVSFFFYLGESSLTLLSLVFGWVNPFLSGTHAAPVHHCIAQNTRVQLCSRARQQGESRQENGLNAHEQTHTHTLSQHHPAFWEIWCFSGVHPGASDCVAGVEVRRFSESAFCKGTGTLTFHFLQLWAELLAAV